MRQTLSRFRCGREWATTKVRSSRAKLVARRSAQTTALLLGGLPGQPVGRGGAVEAVLRAAPAPLADGLGAHAVAPGEDAAGLLRAGDLGADGGRGAGIGVDL